MSGAPSSSRADTPRVYIPINRKHTISQMEKFELSLTRTNKRVYVGKKKVHADPRKRRIPQLPVNQEPTVAVEKVVIGADGKVPYLGPAYKKYAPKKTKEQRLEEDFEERFLQASHARSSGNEQFQPGLSHETTSRLWNPKEEMDDSMDTIVRETTEKQRLNNEINEKFNRLTRKPLPQRVDVVEKRAPMKVPYFPTKRKFPVTFPKKNGIMHDKSVQTQKPRRFYEKSMESQTDPTDLMSEDEVRAKKEQEANEKAWFEIGKAVCDMNLIHFASFGPPILAAEVSFSDREIFTSVAANFRQLVESMGAAAEATVIKKNFKQFLRVVTGLSNDTEQPNVKNN
ncbi:unnamed protein product [Caenorhabditis sp. 36 PRJEB53466]|nr:unnamed protein product [Caenorhabditis sp. 36 PRJEB53466]